MEGHSGSMDANSNDGWGVVAPKKPHHTRGLGTPELPTQARTEPLGHPNRFAELELPEVFPFFNLPRELRDEMYRYLVDEIRNVLRHSRDQRIRQATYASRKAAHALFVSYALPCVRMHEELQKAFYSVAVWMLNVNDYLGRPKSYNFIYNERRDKKYKAARGFMLVGRLKDELPGAVPDYSVSIYFTRNRKKGEEYFLVWSHLSDVKETMAEAAAGLTAADYEAMVSRVEQAFAAMVRQRQLEDGVEGLEYWDISKVVAAFCFHKSFA